MSTVDVRVVCAGELEPGMTVRLFTSTVVAPWQTVTKVGHEFWSATYRHRDVEFDGVWGCPVVDTLYEVKP